MRVATKTEQRKANLVDSWDVVPTFVSEVEEREFWEHHAPSEHLLSQLKPRTLEEEMTAMVRLTGTGPDGEFDITLDLPEDVRRELAAASRSPVRLNILERLIINQVQLIATLFPQSHSTPEHPQSGPDPELMEPEDDLGWMDNLERATEATNKNSQLMVKMNESIFLIGEKLNEELANLERVENSNSQVEVIALRIAALMSVYAEELDKDTMNLRKYTSVMSESYLACLGYVANSVGTEYTVETQKEPIAFLRKTVISVKEIIIRCISAVERVISAVERAEGHQKELTKVSKASKRLRTVLSRMVDALDDVIAFTDMALQKLETLP